jgi:hypothetical protein
LRFILGSALALAALLACGLVVLEVRDWRVERTIARFEAALSSSRAGRLTQLLAEGSVTREQGERILTLLLQPEIVTRTAYPAGQSVGISVERPFHISVAGSRIEFQEQVWGAERQMDASWKSTSTLYGFPEVLNAWIQPHHVQDHQYRKKKAHAMGSPLCKTENTSRASTRCACARERRSDIRVPIHRALRPQYRRKGSGGAAGADCGPRDR